MVNVKIQIDPLKFISRNEDVLSLQIDIEIEHIDKVKTYSLEKSISVIFFKEKPSVPPGFYGGHWYYGDTHCHSTYTWDYYFGNGIYTIPELKSLAMAAGLDWLAVTDHSYNLDESKYDVTKNETTALSDEDLSLFYGEELSARERGSGNYQNNTCHFSGVLNETFVSSVTDIFRIASAPDSQRAIDLLKNAGGLAIINHPGWGTKPFEAWNFAQKTYRFTHGETGIEILNGSWKKKNLGAVTRWVDQRLLKGEKSFPFAGSDTESDNHLGECYTVVYSPSNSRHDIKKSLSRGMHYVTTGPALSIWAKPKGSRAWNIMGSIILLGSAQVINIYVSYNWSASSMTIELTKGAAGQTRETILDKRTVNKGSGHYVVKASLQPGNYVRASAISETNASHRVYTTPIWFK
ncbi:MAG: CehA/McbA family metallohydrolase [Bacillota bacterium]